MEEEVAAAHSHMPLLPPVSALEVPRIGLPIPAPAAPAPRPASGRRWWVPAVAAVIVLGIAAALFFTDKRAILTRIADGRLVVPIDDSAYTRWQQWMIGAPSAADQQEVAGRAIPLLQQRGNVILADLKERNRESEAVWDEAIRVFRWLEELESDQRHIAARQFSEARLHFMRGEHAAAIRAYEAAVAAAPDWALALNGLARALVRIGDRTAAQQYYLKATRADPPWIFPWLNLAAVSHDLKDYGAAVAAAREAIRLDPDRASAHYLLARALDDTRQYCAAVSSYRAAVERAYRNDDPGFNIDAARQRVDRLAPRYGC